MIKAEFRGSFTNEQLQKVLEALYPDINMNTPKWKIHDLKERIIIKSLLLSCFLIFILNFPGKSQDNGQKFEFSPKTAKPNARALMKDDFFWSPIDESGPFGSDGGSDAAYGFYKWRKTHASISPIVYLRDLISSWHYLDIAWDEMDTAKIKKYMSTAYFPTQSEIDQQVNLLKQENNEYQTAPGVKKLSDDEIQPLITCQNPTFLPTFGTQYIYYSPKRNSLLID